MKNILVFPCGSEIGLEIYNAVKYSRHFHLIGLSSVSDHGNFLYEDCIMDAPMITDEGFTAYLCSVIRERAIDAIFPALDSVALFLKKHEGELGGCKVISSDVAVLEICNSKSESYRVLKDVVLTPQMFNLNADLSYPVFAKPDSGYGSRGARRINSVEELKEQLGQFPDSIILEYLPGEEYTIDCFTDINGKLVYANPRIRNRIRGGIAVNTEFVEYTDEFRDIVVAISKRIRFVGAWFVQVKRNEKGKLVLLEIAARSGGSASLSRFIGVNLPLMSIFTCFGMSIGVVKNDYFVQMDRSLGYSFKYNIKFDRVYVDYDDCLIMDEKVNYTLIAFLYRCLNDGKKLILLSKHMGDLREELKSKRLDTLFDEIIQIEPHDRKADYVVDNNAIFIDDAYSERQAVKAICCIPVFSPDMIECF